MVLPLVPSLQAQSTGPSGILDWSEFPLIRKTPRPGFGTWMGAEPANTCSTLWQVRLETFRGVRLELGLGTADSLKIGVMARNKTWLFDCWGRRMHGNDVASYGGMMREGDVIGILYNRAADELTFLQNGVSMGPAFSGLSGKHERRLLYPVIHFPFFPLDTIRILQPGAEDVASATRDAQSCSCDGDDNDTMQWEAPPHPDDGKVRYPAQVVSALSPCLEMTRLTSLYSNPFPDRKNETADYGRMNEKCLRGEFQMLQRVSCLASLPGDK